MAIGEALYTGSQLQAGLDAGISLISQQQNIKFTQYVKKVMPLDGFVFWVRSDLANYESDAPIIYANGSLHFASEKIQDESQTYGLSKVTFTSEEPLDQSFDKIGPNMIYIGSFGNIRFSFSNRQNFYKQAGIWHYIGDAIYPFMESQIIDSAEDLGALGLVVSNSLPLWLALNDYRPFYGFGNSIPLYPSALSPANIRPPFATVHIPPESTEALASSPFLTRISSHYQLSKETVRVTMYGIDNDGAMNFVDCVNQYSQDYGYIGLMNAPIIRDDKVGQNELSVLAMKKTIEFEVSYYQNSVRDIARQLILSAVPNVESIWPSHWPTPYPTAS